MKIPIEVEIFDDSIYCNDDISKCEHLEKRCNLFRELLGFGPNPDRHFKCDQCKEAYKSATKKFNIEREVIATDGHQVFQVQAKTRKEAENLFRSEKGEMIESSIEVLDIEPWDEVDFNDMYED